MPDETLSKFIMDRIHQQRIEILTEYVNSPLLFGHGFRQFDLLQILLPTIGVGPLFRPVPSGTFSDQNNNIFHPIQSLETISGVVHDNLKAYDYRSSNSIYNTDYNGYNIIPGDTEHIRYVDLAATLAAGNLAATDLVNVTGSRICEVMIDSIQIHPLDNAAPVTIIVSFQADAGVIAGMTEHVYLEYLYDVTGGHYWNQPYIIFPTPVRFVSTTGGADPQVVITGGTANEPVRIKYHYRIYTART